MRASFLSIWAKPTEYDFRSGEKQQQREKKCAGINQNERREAIRLRRPEGSLLDRVTDRRFPGVILVQDGSSDDSFTVRAGA
jgi:hypothetical protein